MGVQKWFTENATPIMLEAGWIPVEPYPANTNAKWKCKCALCGKPDSPTFENVKQRLNNSHKGCHDCYIKRGKTEFPICNVKICDNKVETLSDKHCSGHKQRVQRDGKVYATFPLPASLPQNRKCKVPVDDKGTACGKDAHSFCGLNYKKYSKFDPESIKWGKVCDTHRRRWYATGHFDEGVPVKRCAPKDHQTWDERVDYYLDFSNGYIKENKNGCYIWQGRLSHQKGGYASVPDLKRSNRSRFLTRRIWEAKVEPIIECNQIHHICGERRCVNIKHLENISYSENNSEACRVKALRKEIAELKKEIRYLKRAA